MDGIMVLRKLVKAWLQLVFILLVAYVCGKALSHLGTVVAETSGIVSRQYFGVFTLRFEKEAFNIGEYTSATMLFLAGLVSFWTFHVLGEVDAVQRPPRRAFWLVLAGGLIYLGLDELFCYHEFVGLNVPYLTDAHVLLLYLVAASVFVSSNIRPMMPNWVAVCLLGAGFLCHISALGLDYVAEKHHFSGWTPEEVLEVLANTLYATYIFYLAAREMSVDYGMTIVWRRK